MADVRLIDANELKELLAMYLAEHIRLPDKDRTTTFVGVLDWVDSSPTIDAVPVVHGRWVLVSKGNFSPGGLEIEEKCSECGRYVYRYEDQPQDNYCPNCGAKMDGKEG